MARRASASGRAAGGGRLVAIELDPTSLAAADPANEEERAVAIADLLADNRFRPVGHGGSRYRLLVAIRGRNLVFHVAEDEQETTVGVAEVAITSLKRLLRDYALICESHQAALAEGSPGRVEAIDMGRRGLHDEAATLIRDRLASRFELDLPTARRLFTLIVALHWRF